MQFPITDLNEYKRALMKLVDVGCESVKKRYVTLGPTDGLSAAEKEAAALVLKDAWSWKSTECTLLEHSEYLRIMAAIDLLGTRAKIAIASAKTMKEADAAHSAIKWPS